MAVCIFTTQARVTYIQTKFVDTRIIIWTLINTLTSYWYW